MPGGGPSPHAELIDRAEHGVATAAEIGARLYLSVPTVKAHVSSVLLELGVENRTQVALVVHEAGAGDD